MPTFFALRRSDFLWFQRNVGLRERGRIQIGAEIGESARGIDCTIARSKHQAVQPPRGSGELGPPLRGNSSTGSVQHRGPRIEIRTGLGEHANRIGGSGGRPHDGGLAEPFLPRVDVGTAGDQRLQRIDRAGARGGHDDRFAFLGARVRVDAGGEQQFEHFALPFIAASVIGGTPYRFVAFAFAPARSSIVTSSGSSACTAQCSAVVPSTPGAFTSTLPRSCARTAL